MPMNFLFWKQKRGWKFSIAKTKCFSYAIVDFSQCLFSAVAAWASSSIEYVNSSLLLLLLLLFIYYFIFAFFTRISKHYSLLLILVCLLGWIVVVWIVNWTAYVEYFFAWMFIFLFHLWTIVFVAVVAAGDGKRKLNNNKSLNRSYLPVYNWIMMFFFYSEI